MPELRTARENARLETESQRGRNSHQMDVLGIYDLQGLSYDRTELLVAGMRLLAPDPSGSPPAGRCQSTATGPPARLPTGSRASCCTSPSCGRCLLRCGFYWALCLLPLPAFHCRVCFVSN